MALNNQQAAEFAKQEESAPIYTGEENPLAAESKHLAEKRKRKIQETRSKNLPKMNPSRFFFSKEVLASRDKLLLSATFPENTLVQGGDRLTAEDIVVYFDDVMMPFQVENNTIRVFVPRDPYIKLYRPKEYSNIEISVVIYMKNKTGSFIAAFPTKELAEKRESSVLSVINSPAAALLEDPKKKYNVHKLGMNMIGAKPEWLQAKMIHKSTLRIYCQPPNHGNIASDSESDHEETVPTGVVAKNRFNLDQHYRLPISFRAKNVLYTIMQGYLHGAFIHGDPKAEKSSRNTRFTDSLRYTPEMAEEQRVQQAHQFAVEMLEAVGRYYLSKENIFRGNQDLRKSENFREGLLQLLDFCHAFGSQGSKPFQIIFQLAIECGVYKFEVGKTICFHFQRITVRAGKERTMPRQDVQYITLTFRRTAEKVVFNEEVDENNFAQPNSDPNVMDIDQPNYEEDLFKSFDAMSLSEDGTDSSASAESKASKDLVSGPAVLNNGGSQHNGGLQRPAPLPFLQGAPLPLSRPAPLPFLQQAPQALAAFSLAAGQQPGFNGAAATPSIPAETSQDHEKDELEEVAASARRDIGKTKRARI